LDRVDIKDMLDVLFLLIVLLSMVGVFRVARGLSGWRSERRVDGERGTSASQQTRTVQRLASLRDSGSLSEEEFEAAKIRIREE
jgi:hypothetical protein